MGINGALFLQQLDGIVPDCGGFKRVMEGINLNTMRLATGAILAADSGNPGRVSSETYFETVVLPSSQTDLGTLTFSVPRDFDAHTDYMAVRFLCNSGGTTDAPTLDAAVYQKKVGTALSANLDPTASAVISKASATTGAAWREIVADGLSLVPGAALTWILSTAGTRGTTDSVVIYAVEVEYFSDLVYNDETDRA
jgi:hypothetical protein